MIRSTLIWLVLMMTPSLAHNKSLSFSDWLWQDTSISVSFTVPLRDATLLPDVATATSIDEALATHLTQYIELQQLDKNCLLSRPYQRAPAHGDYIKMVASYQCFDSAAPLKLRNHAFFNLARSHVHFARLRLAAQSLETSQEFLFTATQRQHMIARNEQGQLISQSDLGDTLSHYFKLGLQHILTGLDHLAFVLCLLLLAQNRRQLFILITGFTLGHSLTLGLAALGFIAPNSVFVEAMIGGSIALVASEYILARQNAMTKVAMRSVMGLFVLSGVSVIRGGEIALTGWAGLMLFCLCYGLRIRSSADASQLAPIMTFGFGLFHGFGFAGLLSDIGLPQGQVIGGLIGFNLGVEVGQILFIVPVLLAARYLAPRLPQGKLSWADATASGLTCFGVFLFVQRTLF